MSSNLAIGIDLGTMSSCVATFVPETGQVLIIPNDHGNLTTPSMVSFSDNHRMVGERAKQGQSRALEQTIFGVKRLLGREYLSPGVAEDAKWWPYHIGRSYEKVNIEPKGNKHLPEEMVAMILSAMKRYANSHLNDQQNPNQNIKNAVITVPACFNDAQRQAVKDAGRIAGLNVLRLLNEPSAAALAYAFNNPGNFVREKRILVLDLGAGHYNVAVIGVRGAAFDVRAVAGDTQLGGEEFTRALVRYCLKHKMGLDFSEESRKEIMKDRKSLHRIYMACEQAKVELSTLNSTKIEVTELLGRFDLIWTLTREDFEQVCVDLFKKLVDPFKKALQDSKLDLIEVDEILLIGGGARMPKIQELLRGIFSKFTRVIINTDETAVAAGAALMAAILNNYGQQQGQSSEHLKNIQLIDVAPLSLGVELADGGLGVIIPANTNIPTTRVKSFAAVSPPDERDEKEKLLNPRRNVKSSFTLLIKIFEGENVQKAADNHCVGEFLFQSYRPDLNKDGDEASSDFDVCFQLDADGILQVTAAVDDKEGNSNRNNRTELTISGKKSRLPLSQIAEMKRDIERLEEEEGRLAHRSETRNSFDAYLSKVRANLELASNGGGSQSKHRRKIEHKLDKYQARLDKKNPTEKEVEKLRRKLEKLVFLSQLRR